MKRLIFYIITISVFCTFLPSGNTGAAVMEDYCQAPPYITQNIAPNVMIVLDNSGSMFNFAYFDGFTTPETSDDNMCVSAWCSEYSTPGTYPSYKYYGLFDPDYWYTYSSNRFRPADPKTGSGLSGARAKTSSEWDGNYLNWVTMRRVDIIRKVMTGGKTSSGEGSGYSRLKGEIADCNSRGRWKLISSGGNYTPYNYSNIGIRVNTANGSCNGSGSGTPDFSIWRWTGSSWSYIDDFNVAVRVPDPVEGVLQRVVGTKARMGLSFYNVNSPTPQGGYTQVYVSGGSLSSTVNQINLSRPNSNTPLAETLWTMTGYFAQQASMEGGPGPRYSGGDYQINNNVDPLNYGTGGQPRYPSCAKSFILYITDGEPCADGYLPGNIKDYANGKSAYDCYDLSPGSPGRDGYCPAVGTFTESYLPSCSGGGQGGYVAGLEDVALYAHTTDLRSSTLGKNDIPGIQNLTLYTVFAFGKGSTLLRYTAINGGFEDSNGNNIPDLQSEWDADGNNEPDTFYEAVEGYKLEEAINEALSTMLKRAASGTAASVLASGEGSGANLLQAAFYPRRRFGNEIIYWTGMLQNLWFHIDPFLDTSSIREDTDKDDQLHLKNDYILSFEFNTTVGRTEATRIQDVDGDGKNLSTVDVVALEDIKNIWEAGKLLFLRKVSATGPEPGTVNPRVIKAATTNSGSLAMEDFSITNAPNLKAELMAATDTEAENIIKYLHGEDISGYRNRTVTMDGDTGVWKLGDIINSTPRIVSWIPLNTYDEIYSDNSYYNFINTYNYQNRGMVYTGANDGMLHAFNLGKLEIVKNNIYLKARLTGTGKGEESWAFIPKNALPYLKYIADPEYCHIYSNDSTVYTFDASIGGNATDTRPSDGSSWRTVLIGGMRYGGACRDTASACTDCVKTPESNNGYSSYYALDITDQNNPVLLWEFSNNGMGFTTSGASIVRISTKYASMPEYDTNGRWYVVFASGPTGPIIPAEQQFMGRSDQNLKLFILDLKTGTLLRTIDTGITYAFGGSITNSTIDPDLDYQDDAIYLGYTNSDTGTGDTWTNGGVIRIFTKENTDPGQWVWKKVIENIGAVTSGIARLEDSDSGKLWLYFGTGRYFYETNSSVDDPTTSRELYGIKDPSYSYAVFNTSWTTLVNPGALQLITDADAATATEDNEGWYINLDLQGVPSADLSAERVITDTVSSTTGVVIFTTYKPSYDECVYGGKSFLWAVKHDTGGTATGLLRGKALIQVSTGSIEEIDLDSAFTDKGNRRTAAIEGVPPAGQGLSLLTSPSPSKTIMHMIER